LTTTNIPTFQDEDGEKYLECILQKGDHDFTATDSPKQISTNVYSISVICIDCGYTCEKYQFIGDSEID
jgi:hypothetical protein